MASLSVNDPRGGRSRSPGARDRSRSRDARVPAPAPPPPRSKKYYESDSTESEEEDASRYARSKGSKVSDYDYARTEPKSRREDPRYDAAEPRRHRGDARYEEAEPRKVSTALTRRSKDDEDSEEEYLQWKREKARMKEEEERRKERRYREEEDDDRKKRDSRYAEPDRYEYAKPPKPERHGSRDDGYELPGQYKEYDDDRRYHPTSPTATRPEAVKHVSSPHSSTKYHADYQQPLVSPRQDRAPSQQLPPGYSHLTHTQVPHDAGGVPRTHSGSVSSTGQAYQTVDKYKYADVPQQITYVNKTDHDRHASVQLPRTRPAKVEVDDHRRASEAVPKHLGAQVVEVKPGARNAPPSSGLVSGARRLSINTAGGLGANLALASPGHGSGPLPPGSPLLESYSGTYQQIGYMPSPMMFANVKEDELSDLEALDGLDDTRPRSILKKKKVEIYDPKKDSLTLADALKHTTPEPGPLVRILPSLSDDNILALRTEYKKYVKISGKGINIAKHIKLKVPGNIGKVAYATALGRWESEAHWANSWYQSDHSRRELLIESLIGRTNAEIRKIKDAFTDKRYNDSLEKCMQTELKKDKFRNAILLALKEERQEELAAISKQLVKQDVVDLYRALTAREGGETAMIEIIVVRSDSHLREVLRDFESRFQKNFAREMIQKSRNLVGETLAHILNGVLNRPVRDAMLLNQAITEQSKDRFELLISRLVRYHWEPKHLERIKVEYRRKYGKHLETDIDESTKGDFGDFCVALCKGGSGLPS